MYYSIYVPTPLLKKLNVFDCCDHPNLFFALATMSYTAPDCKFFKVYVVLVENWLAIWRSETGMKTYSQLPDDSSTGSFCEMSSP